MEPKHPVSLDNTHPSNRDINRKKQQTKNAAKKKKNLINSFLPCLLFMGSDVEKAELINLLIKSNWFVKPCWFSKFFNNNVYERVLEVKPKYVPYLAWLLAELYDYQLISTDRGKAYMQVACQLIYCNKHPLSAKKLLDMNSETRGDTITHKQIIDAVNKIIRNMEFMGGNTFSRRIKQKKNQKLG